MVSIHRKDVCAATGRVLVSMYILTCCHISLALEPLNYIPKNAKLISNSILFRSLFPKEML